MAVLFDKVRQYVASIDHVYFPIIGYLRSSVLLDSSSVTPPIQREVFFCSPVLPYPKVGLQTVGRAPPWGFVAMLPGGAQIPLSTCK